MMHYRQTVNIFKAQTFNSTWFLYNNCLLSISRWEKGKLDWANRANRAADRCEKTLTSLPRSFSLPPSFPIVVKSIHPLSLATLVASSFSSTVFSYFS